MRFLTLAGVALTVLVGCATTPLRNAELDRAHEEVRMLESQPNAAEVASACEALAGQLIDDLPDLGGVAMVGIVSHGALLAMRLRELIDARTKVRLPCAAADIAGGADVIAPLDGSSEFEVEGRTIVLVDDVINSGWTVQRAMTAFASLPGARSW